MRPERPSLASQQTALMSLITGRDLGAITPGAASLIVGDARATADERLHVYAHMYRARIVEALESQFPRLARLLGADEFAALATAYIRDEPSRHPSLRFVGERLPAWLAARPPDAPTQAGLAALEWARADVLDLADEPTLTMEAVREWPVDRFGELPLRLVTAQRLVRVAAGTSRLWDALGADIAGRASEGTAGSEGGGDADADADESLLVWREDTIVYHRLVDDAERAALALAGQGASFGVVCESLFVSRGEAAAIAQAYAWMSTWLADGLLRSFE